MQLYVVSDIHTEFEDFIPPEIEADYVVLAGDIGVGTAGVEWAAGHFSDVPVIYVPGNHEYYNCDIRSTERMKAVAADNVHVLDREVFDDGRCRFLGITLWTDFKFDGDSKAASSQQTAAALMYDYRAIRNGDCLFTPQDSVL